MTRQSHRRLGCRAAVAMLVAVGLVSAFAVAARAAVTDKTVAVRTPELHWSDCQDGFQCAVARVPLDYDRPGGKQLELSLIRLTALDPARRIGTLFVNFGGPGASGVDRLRARATFEWLFSRELRTRFDLVSWDQRGVSRSAAVRCFQNERDQQEFLGSYPETPIRPADEAGYFAVAADLSRRCLDVAGGLLDHVSSANSARDLEMLRRAVGDARLTYHGLTYGSFLGAVYANMFPHRVKALAFDGVPDFIGNAVGHGNDGRTKPIETRLDVARGIADTFDQFLIQCTAAGAPACAFAAGGDPARKWPVLAERARQAPISIETPDGTFTYTYATLINTAAALHLPSFWPTIADTLQVLYDASGTRAAARGTGVRPRGEPYLSNLVEAFYAIQCVDSDVPRSTGLYSELASSEDLRVPYFGRLGVFNAMPCATWPGRDADRYTGPWNRRTSAPILLLNNRYDPATPLHGALAAARQLDNARLLVVEGSGHTSMFVPSTCAERVKREYFISGVLPPNGATCAVDAPPFGAAGLEPGSTTRQAPWSTIDS